MNKSSLLGFSIFGGVIYSAVFAHAKTPEIFFDSHALILVLGGTVAAALVAYPYASLSRTVDYLLWGLLFKKKKEYLKVSQEIAAARNSFFSSQTYVTAEEAHPFFREASMFLMNRNIDDTALEEILRNRSEYFKRRYEEDATVLKSLAKYPVSFGFLAGVTALIEVMPALQSHTVDLASGLLHGVALGLVGLFWGLALANFLILPVADSAGTAADEDTMLRSLIIDGMVLIRTRATDDHFQAYLRGYLSLADRTEFKIYTGKNVIPFATPIQKKVVAVPETVVTASEVVAPLVAAVRDEPPAPTEVEVSVSEAESSSAREETVSQAEPIRPPAMPQVQVQPQPVVASVGQVEKSISVVSRNPTDLAEFDFKDLKNLLRDGGKSREVRKKYR